MTPDQKTRPAGTIKPTGTLTSVGRLVRAEFFKIRTTSTLWVFMIGALISTSVMLAIDCVNANSLLKPFAEYVTLETHGHRDAGQVPPEFLARMHSEWLLGHSAVTQAATIYTAGQLIGVLLACLLGIVLITGEYHHQTATSTFLQTPHRDRVVAGKLGTAIGMAFLAWLLSTVVSVVTGAIFLHAEGFGTQLGNASVLRAIGLNVAAYAIWSVFGIGFGALIRSQLGATVSATVLYLIGATAAAGVFDLVYTYLIPKSWVLTAQVIVPAVASTVMISPTKTFDQSPPQWVGAAILVGYGIVAGAIGTWVLRRRDIA